jgi:hypothetical protein
MSKELTPMETLIEYVERNRQSTDNKYSIGALRIVLREATELLQSESTFIRKKEREAAEKSIWWMEEYSKNKEATTDGVANYLNHNFPL